VTEKIKVIVLAAGKGTRLQTDENDAPKVMRTANGKPLLWHVLEALSFIDREDIIIVVGYKKEEITDNFSGYVYAEQTEQLGTGHAVMAAAETLAGYPGTVLVCYGDMPLIRDITYETFISEHFYRDNDCTILTGQSSIPLPYGRVVRGATNEFLRVVEDRDCTPEQLEITELNSGVYLFQTPMLLDALGCLGNDNVQGEYYLTDVPEIIRDRGGTVGLFRRNLGDEIIGVNTVEQLELVEEILAKRLLNKKAP